MAACSNHTHWHTLVCLKRKLEIKQPTINHLFIIPDDIEFFKFFLETNEYTKNRDLIHLLNEKQGIFKEQTYFWFFRVNAIKQTPTTLSKLYRAIRCLIKFHSRAGLRVQLAN